jgi:hypothetical protein
MKKIDLHIHTTASDGKFSPEEVVEIALKNKMEMIAITDHDTTAGLEKAIKYYVGKNIKIIQGIEIGCAEEDLKLNEIHIVGLFINPSNEKLKELIKKLNENRIEQKKEMIVKLNKLGYEISFEELKQEVGESFGRPHIARILIRKYPEKFKTVQDVFNKLLDRGLPGYAEKKTISLEETILTILSSGGIPILAHPGIYAKKMANLVEKFVQYGGKGMEADYPYDKIYGLDKNKIITEVKKMAKENNLLISGGSDFHDFNRGSEIGDGGVDKKIFKALINSVKMEQSLKNNIKKVGIVAMPRVSVGGGFARVFRDLIFALNSMNLEVHVLNPFEVNLEKISQLYGPIKIEKIYSISKTKAFFCREESLGRKLIKKEFQEFAKNVDFIIDMEGCILHEYLPEGFDKSNYVVWRISCIDPNVHKLQKFSNPKVVLKNLARKISLKQEDLPNNVKIYPVDEWTKKEITEFWKVPTQKLCLYPEIKTDEFYSAKKKNQMVILGRIAPNKTVDESVRIFAEGTKKYPDYKLIIIGGSTPETEEYLVKINEVINELNLKERVEIIKDAPFQKVKEVLSESKVIIDSQIGTSMNMPIVESMASGCIPLMRKYSGTYTEVLDNGKYGYGFDTIEEGSKKLEEILDLLKKKKINNKSAIKRADFFSPKNFRMRLRKILNKEE